MPDSPRRRVAVELPWRTIFKALAAAALVWLWLFLYKLVLWFIVAVVFALTLDPVVDWMEKRGWRRSLATATLGAALAAILGIFLWMTWASLSSQMELVATRIPELERTITDSIPQGVRDALGISPDTSIGAALRPSAMRVARSAAYAAGVIVLAFALTLYLLIDGQRTLEWLEAFVPRSRRGKTDATLVESRRVIFRYMVGNVATSISSTVVTFIGLTLLDVPAALLMALFAGVMNLLPIVGIVISLVPAALLGLTVSPLTGLGVVALYIGYNLFETYWIGPRVYGEQLDLSNLAVILAVVVGAQIGGVVGAFIALPLAALYPTIERIWLRDQLGDAVVREHGAIERRRAG